MGNSEHADYVIEYLYRVNFFSPSLAKNNNAIGAIIFAINADENMHGDLDPQGRAILRRTTAVATGALLGGDLRRVGEWHAKRRGRFQPLDLVHARRRAPVACRVTRGVLQLLDRQHRREQGREARAVQGGYREDTVSAVAPGAPQRKKDREETLKAVAQFQPAAEVAKLRKELEDAERDAGEELKKSESQDREDAKTAFKPTDDMRAELNRMTPSQRKLPAIVDAVHPARAEWRANWNEHARSRYRHRHGVPGPYA